MPGPPGSFPLGTAVTMRDLDTNLHPVLRRLRASEPVSWLPVLGGWLVTRRDLVLRVLRDSRTFTVDDPRFSTARVIGPSMLSLDGAEHKRHRDPFAEAFRTGAAAARLEEVAEAEAARLVAGFAAAGGAELRRSLAGPLAVAVVADVLGLGQTDPKAILGWYDEIVGAVSALAGQSGEDHEPGRAAGGSAAFAELSASLRAAMAGAHEARGPHGTRGPHEARGPHRTRGPHVACGAHAHAQSLLAAAAGAGGLGDAEVVSNAAVLMFGGIETTEGMICNAVLHLLGHPAQLAAVIADPGLAANAVEESLRLEPAAAIVDRYATADVALAGASIRRGDLVTVSLAGANRDPAVFADPDRFDVRRANARQNLAFAHGPHFCLGAQLARAETRAAMAALLRLPGLRLDPSSRPVPRGVVFRKPSALHVLWDVPAPSRS
jgi:cytochrome P450